MALLKQCRLSVVPLISEQWKNVMIMIGKKTSDEGQELEDDSNEGSKRRRAKNEQDIAESQSYNN